MKYVNILICILFGHDWRVSIREGRKQRQLVYCQRCEPNSIANQK